MGQHAFKCRSFFFLSGQKVGGPCPMIFHYVLKVPNKFPSRSTLYPTCFAQSSALLNYTSGCPWPKATVKSPVGACNLRPLFFIFSYFSLFIFYCSGRPAPALPRPLPCFEFSFCCQGQEEEVTQGTDSGFFFLLLPRIGGRSYTKNGQCFNFLLLPGTRGGSYTGKLGKRR
jgi:hypothetical protein